MKLKIFILMIFTILLTTIFSFNTYAATWEFRWTNTVVRIPLGGNLSEYSIIPEAKLYRDGILLADANVSYLRTGDFLNFLSNVNTTKIGTYKVWYKASENDKYCPGTCTGYRELISFIVEDSIAPKLDIIKDNLFIQRVSSLTPEAYDDLLNKINNNINASDNYSDCEIKINQSVDFTTNGSYPIDVSAIDTSGNRTTKSFNVTIYDNSYPVINYNGEEELDLPLNGNINIRDYFSAYDEVDGDISSLIQYPALDLTTINEYNYTVTVKNKSGNSTSRTIRINVIDNSAPTITIPQKTLLLDYKTDFESYDFSSKVIIKDNQPIDYDNLSITTNVVNEVGTYTVWYSYTDGINTVSDELTIKCISKEKPKIYTDDIIIDKDSNVELKNYITVIDDSDDNIMDSVEIDDSKVTYNKEGTYYANVYAINSSGLSSTERIRIIVGNSGISNINIPILIMLIILSVVTIGYGVFFIYYFLIKKKKEKNG